MSISKFNSAGCFDPTAFEALTRIEQETSQFPYMPIVYICSPFSGDIDRNQKRARSHCRFALDQGYIPIAMHLLLPQFMNDSDLRERNLALFINLILMGKCKEVWVFGDCISDGMAIEITKAKKRGQPIRYFGLDHEEVEEYA